MNILISAFIGLMLYASLASATTYYVDDTGTGTNCTQAQSPSTPHNTILEGVACLSGGDTLIIGSGTYAEYISYVDTALPPSGADWNNATIIQAATGETVTLLPASTGVTGNVIALDTTSYVIFQDLILDGTNAPSSVIRLKGTANHIRFIGGVAKNSGENGIYIQDPTTNFNEFINMEVSGNGFVDCPPCGHGFYVRGPDQLIQSNTVHSNYGYGMQIYTGDTSRTKIIGNRVYNNDLGGNSYGGVLLIGGNDMQAYNNIIYNNTGTGLEVSFGSADGVLLYNNTIYGNDTCINVEQQGGETVIDVEARNNVCWNNTQTIVNTGTNTIISNNLTTDPLFVSAPSDFHLQLGSDAIDSGFSLSGLVDTDFDGTARPQNSVWDIGAFEFGSSPMTQPGVPTSPSTTAASTPVFPGVPTGASTE